MKSKWKSIQNSFNIAAFSFLAIKGMISIGETAYNIYKKETCDVRESPYPGGYVPSLNIENTEEDKQFLQSDSSIYILRKPDSLKNYKLNKKN